MISEDCIYAICDGHDGQVEKIILLNGQIEISLCEKHYQKMIEIEQQLKTYYTEKEKNNE